MLDFGFVFLWVFAVMVASLVAALAVWAAWGMLVDMARSIRYASDKVGAMGDAAVVLMINVGLWMLVGFGIYKLIEYLTAR